MNGLKVISWKAIYNTKSLKKLGHYTKQILKQSILLRIKRAIQKYERVNSSIGNVINIYEPKTAKIHIFGCQRNLYFSVVTLACLYESFVTAAELTSNHWKWKWKHFNKKGDHYKMQIIIIFGVLMPFIYVIDFFLWNYSLN